MNAADMVLLPSRGDEACWTCHQPIAGEYTHLVEDGVDVIACVGCAITSVTGEGS